MTVEACKAGKDVYVEKPICVAVDEGAKMVQAARKYNRVVQAGTMQRSATALPESVRDGARRASWARSLSCAPGTTATCRRKASAIRRTSAPPAGLDWDMWLGPAPKRAVQRESLRRRSERRFSHFRWFWDYAGGMMTDWGVHCSTSCRWPSTKSMPTRHHRAGRQVVPQGQSRHAGHAAGDLRISRIHRHL